MSRLLHTPVGRLRLVALAEGTSFLVLLGIAMPLKYLAGRPEAVRIAGMAHGILFLLYLAAVAQAALGCRWPRKTVALLLVASVLPGGPFYADARLLRPADEGA